MSISPSVRRALILTLAVMALGGGCAELRGRQKAREGNDRFKEGRYREAVSAYSQAELLLPDFPAIALNKGLACRQMMVPGAKTPENEAAVACALSSFEKLKRLQPDDRRGEQLHVQTLFDAERYETLVATYQQQVAKNPGDLEAVNGLAQVYSRWNRFDDALRWYVRRAELQPRDATAQYSVGVFLWQQLFARGGGPDKAGFDPRPDPEKPREKKVAPPFGLGDLVGADRVRLADVGLAHLEKALLLRPDYHEALTYMNLLYRQRSLAFLDQPDKWQAAIDQAEKWRRQAVAAQQKGAGAAATP